MAEKKSFLIYLDNQKQVNMLSDEQAGKLFKALFEFAKNGTETEFDDGMIAIVFGFMSDSIKRDTEKYEEICKKRTENIKKRWNKKQDEENTNHNKKDTKNTNEYNCNFCNTNDTDIDKDNDIDNDNDKDKDIDKDKDNDNDKDMEIDKEIEKEEFFPTAAADVKSLMTLYNDICKSLPPVKAISKECRDNAEKILNQYSIDDIKTAFEKAEKSLFLKGEKNGKDAYYKNWKADFEWLMRDLCFARLLNGKYDNTKDDEMILMYSSLQNL